MGFVDEVKNFIKAFSASEPKVPPKKQGKWAYAPKNPAKAKHKKAAKKRGR